MVWQMVDSECVKCSTKCVKSCCAQLLQVVYSVELHVDQGTSNVHVLRCHIGDSRSAGDR